MSYIRFHCNSGAPRTVAARGTRFKSEPFVSQVGVNNVIGIERCMACIGIPAHKSVVVWISTAYFSDMSPLDKGVVVDSRQGIVKSAF